MTEHGRYTSSLLASRPPQTCRLQRRPRVGARARSLLAPSLSLDQLGHCQSGSFSRGGHTSSIARLFCLPTPLPRRVEETVVGAMSGWGRLSRLSGLSRSPSDDSSTPAEAARRSARYQLRPRPTTEEDGPQRRHEEDGPRRRHEEDGPRRRHEEDGPQRRRPEEEARSRWRMSRSRLLAAGRSPGRRPPGSVGEESDEEMSEQTSHRVRVLARRALTLCQRSDWVAVDQSLKSLERAALEGRLGPCPLQNIVDEVRLISTNYAVCIRYRLRIPEFGLHICMFLSVNTVEFNT